MKDRARNDNTYTNTLENLDDGLDLGIIKGVLGGVRVDTDFCVSYTLTEAIRRALVKLTPWR
jgi:hypothetical protein